ncbi:MAG: helix-turn-helix transcriptional regulator [Bradymonadaceae bacterium]|nr:helix-turn-helix transcriptional regulator [Lujinxingiaceae bacterium]
MSDQFDSGPRVECIEINGAPVYVLSLSLEPALPDELSSAERAVVLLVLSGASNAEIAELRGTALQTVANQLHSAFKKMGINSRGDLAAAVYGA